MDYVPIPRNWFESQYENDFGQRRSFLISDNPTATERYKIKELLQAVHVRLSDFEDRLRILEKKKAEGKDMNGPQEITINSSFEALLFWLRLLERNMGNYSRKMGIETEFGMRIKVVRKRIRMLVKGDSNIMDENRFSEDCQ